MTQDAQADFWTMLKQFRSCMVVTRDNKMLRSRPMAPLLRANHDEHIYFLTKRSSHKTMEIEAQSDINLSFSDPKANNYISVSGQASLSTDIGLKKELWNEWADAWFENGAEDPDAAVMIVNPQAAELWDGTQSIVKTVWELAKAKLTNLKPDLGDNKKVRFGA